MFREKGRLHVERCQMVYITAGEWQRKGRGSKITTERKERQISVTKPASLKVIFHYKILAWKPSTQY